MSAATWQKHRDEGGFFHTLETGEEGYFVKVEKTRGGDYLITAMHEDDPAGGEVEFRDALLEAKRYAESIVSSGEWKELVGAA